MTMNVTHYIVSLFTVCLLAGCNTMTKHNDDTLAATAMKKQSQLSDEEIFFVDTFIYKVPMYIKSVGLSQTNINKQKPEYIQYSQCLDNVDMTKARVNAINIVKQTVSEPDYNEIVAFLNTPIAKQVINYQLYLMQKKRNVLITSPVPSKPDTQASEVFMQTGEKKYSKKLDKIDIAWDSSTAKREFTNYIVNEYEKCGKLFQ